jgi:hypothetical protein
MDAQKVALGVVHQVFQGHHAYGEGTYVLLRLMDESPPPRISEEMVGLVPRRSRRTEEGT